MKKGKVLLGLLIVSAAMMSCGNSKTSGEEQGVSKSTEQVSTSNSTVQTSDNVAQALPTGKPEGPLPEFQFETETHDFGTIDEGDVVEHVFGFTNQGDAPLIISAAKPSCGCTVPEWPKEPIPVGESGEIKVRFDSKKKPGIQNKSVTLTANTWPATKRLTFKVNVNKVE